MPVLIVALDVPRLGTARALAESLASTTHMRTRKAAAAGGEAPRPPQAALGFKVGLELLMVEGPRAVRTIAPFGPIFADAKLHDIPHTVSRAASALGRLGPVWVTVHALGGGAMIRAAREGLAEGAQARGFPRPKVLAVTVLTSHDRTTLVSEVGLPGTPEEEALRLAALALQHGADGIVCSAREVSRMRAELGREAILATPGIRAEGEEMGDQRRTTTAREAVRQGSDLVIVGRPVTGAQDPTARLRSLLEEVSHP